MAYHVNIAVAGGLLNARRLRRANEQRQGFISTEDVQLAIRLTQADVITQSTEFDQWRSRQGPYRVDFSTSTKRVTEFLAYVARVGYYHQVGLAYGVAKVTLMGHVKEVAHFFTAIAPQHIQLPQVNEFAALTTPLQEPANPQVRDHYKVILYIDGFIVKIQRPDHAGDAYFCGRHGKSCDSINVQYITDKDGRVRHIITGLSGSTHDRTAAAWSADLMHFLNNLPPGYYVLGDPAYRALRPRVITTFTGYNLTPDQLAFNNSCTRIRQIVECTIGASQLKWRVQQLKNNKIAAKAGVVFAAQCTLAAAVLHNRFTNFL